MMINASAAAAQICGVFGGRHVMPLDILMLLYLVYPVRNELPVLTLTTYPV
jgi:hypothetical protein